MNILALGGSCLFLIYTTMSFLTAIPVIDRRLREAEIHGIPFRSFLPFWGLFAQKFGIFDIKVVCAHSLSPVDSEDEVDRTEITDLTRKYWISWLWHPHLRVEQISYTLSFRCLGSSHVPPNIRNSLPAYRNLLLRVSELVPSTRGFFRFEIYISRGYWSVQEPLLATASEWQSFDSLEGFKPSE